MENSNKISAYSLILTTASILTTACAGTNQADGHGEQPMENHGAVHWEYSGKAGPEHWGSLSPDFAVCGKGQQQSPIDINQVVERDLANIAFNYEPSKVNILNNGHTVQVNYDTGSYIELDGIRYDLLQFHFHAPSEHAINGQLADAEIHFVHKNTAGQLAVVGVLLVQGEEHPAYHNVIAHLPATEGPVQTVNASVEAAKLLPPTPTTYRYLGSLTTPPCSEGVTWLVKTEPVQLSKAQLEAYTAIFMGNNRPTQPLNKRLLVQDISS